MPLLTRAELEAVIEKLPLEPNDILICHDSDVAERLSEIQIPSLTFSVPIIYAPDGVEKIPRDELLKMIGAGDAPKET